MEQMRIEERVTEIKCRCKEKIIYCSRMFRFHSNYLTRGMLLLTKAKRPLKFKCFVVLISCAVKLRMHKAAPYAFPIPLNTF